MLNCNVGPERPPRPIENIIWPGEYASHFMPVQRALYFVHPTYFVIGQCSFLEKWNVGPTVFLISALTFN